MINGKRSHVCLAGKHADAVTAARRAVELDPDSYVTRMALQGVLHFSGRLEKSVAAGELALDISGRLSWSMTFLAVTFAEWEKPNEADAIYSEMLARSRRQYVPSAQLALAAAAASREDDALRHAGDAFQIRDPDCQVFFSPHIAYSGPLYEALAFSRNGRSQWSK